MQLTCYINKAKEENSFGRFFGKWNRRFLFFYLEEMELYYSKRPNSVSKSYLPIKVKFSKTTNNNS